MRDPIAKRTATTAVLFHSSLPGISLCQVIDSEHDEPSDVNVPVALAHV